MAVLAEFNERIDEQGRVFSPFIERGSDNVPEIIPLPTTEDLKGFSTKNPENVAQMSTLLGRYGFESPDQMVELQARHLASFNIQPGQPGTEERARYDAEMERLRTSQSGRVLMSQSRRTQEQYMTLKAIDGNPQQECIRLAEGDAPCDRCEPLDGITKTYAEFVGDNDLPGGSSCEGGDLCLCLLFPVD